MKRLSAQYIITNSGPPLKRGIITADDEGTITGVADTGGAPDESHHLEFYNGIIIPGFVNCHSHLELSCMKGRIDGGKGLGDFIMKVRSTRETDPLAILSAAASADREMHDDGVELCADTCNTSSTFSYKKKSRVRYINLLEIFGIDPLKAEKRMNDLRTLSAEAENSGLPWQLVPHSVYSVSLPLLRLLKNESLENKITSIHFIESESEHTFLCQHSGSLKKSYENSGLLPSRLEMATDHATAILEEVTGSGNLILVHNTFIERRIITSINNRGNTFWCLCPRSNLFVENSIPPVNLLISEGCEIVIGTDSLASNSSPGILDELKTLQHHFPLAGLEELVRWATLNGARALHEDQKYGQIKPGMKPGLILLENLDLENFKLLPETTVKRLL
jgi:cytosine/adenosine deaminase-related metal-dependent hydrolase